MIKNLPANAGDAGDIDLIPGLGRSLGEENGNPLQYSCLDNTMDRGACQAIQSMGVVGLSFQRGCRGTAGVGVSHEAVPNSCG